ncbi:class III aminotransferase [Hyaloraphidium curvatum]|nr:class III aminotransferase [Hyaloraphidium curvatum]
MAATQVATETFSLVDAALAEAKQDFQKRNPKSLEHYESEATQRVPGGGSRLTLVHPPYPLFVTKARGNRLWDLDGHEYLDLFGDATAGIYGHSHPVIHRALQAAMDVGLNLGGHNLYEAKFAQEVCRRWNLDLVRFTNSGTEGNLMAIQNARIVTGRDKVMVFDGCYHGGCFIFRGGPTPICAPFDYCIGRFNDVNHTRELIRQNAKDLACVILEVMLGGGGCIPASKEFIHMLREETEREGICLIFDEVMTNRLSPSGISTLYGVMPDITTLGKSIGGGMSFGGWGGKAKYLSRFDPRRADALPHAGTFNNNSISMTAGYFGITEAFTEEACVALNAKGDRLRERLNETCRKASAPLLFTGIGSMLCVHATILPTLTTVEQMRTHTSQALRELFFFDMLTAGIWGSKTGTINLSLPFSDADADFFVSAVAAWIDKRKPVWDEVRRELSAAGKL